MIILKVLRIDWIVVLVGISIFFFSCKKADEGIPATDTALSFTVNGAYNGTLTYSTVSTTPVILFTFTEPVNASTVDEAIQFSDASQTSGTVSLSLSDGDRVLTISPITELHSFTEYTLRVTGEIRSASGGRLLNPVTITLFTGLNEQDKFPRISDDELLTLVQRRTFAYFWDFAHPVSGMARERNTSGDIVTTGGTGFGIMAIPVAVERGFITRAEGLERLQKIIGFLKTADRFRGAFPHWLNGNTGRTQRFSEKDDGADLVETSLLLQGLLTVKQYFNGTSGSETTLRDDISELYASVDWNWFRKDNSNVLYWHWSANYEWEMNLPIRGWNECLITYVLAAASPTHPVPKSVYDDGWARNGGIKNGNSYYGIHLPLGPPQGGPLFLSHYSFLGINPNGLSDAYASYEAQVKAHTLINRAHCVANPGGFYGYSEHCWGLTASDIPGGYTASSPLNDRSVIAPTAALASFPYTPTESMQALHFFYYKLGDKIWGEYGFKDAFSLHEPWFADSYLAIDQGPIIIMIENYRTGLVWQLLMASPEIKTGLTALGFSSPHI